MTRTLRFLLVSFAVLALPGDAVLAVPVTYTSRTSFESDIAGLASSTVDFDALADGTLIASGDTVGGMTFQYDFGGVLMQVRDDFSTVSPPNSLGTDDGGVFIDGDDFTLSFAPARAIGLTFITADAVLDDDIVLSAAGTSVGLSTKSLRVIDKATGSAAFFLGIADDSPSITSASITTVGGGFFFYNVDDVITAVPEPASAALVGLGLAVLGARHVRRARAGRRRAPGGETGGRARAAALLALLAAPVAALALPAPAGAQRLSVSDLAADHDRIEAKVDDTRARVEAAPTPLTACTRIEQSGAYVATRNLEAVGGADCLVVAVSHVEIDLGGFVVAGSGAGDGITQDTSVSPPVEDVVVRDGVVRGFYRGVFFNVSGVTVRRVRATGNTNGIFLAGPSSAVLECVASRNSQRGIETTADSRVIGNLVHENFQGLRAGPDSLVAGNVARENSFAGIVVDAGSVVRGNTAKDNGRNGISVGEGSVVAENTATGNATFGGSFPGITVGAGSVVRANAARANGDRGIFVWCPSSVVGNAAVGNPAGNLALVNLGCADADNAAP